MDKKGVRYGCQSKVSAFSLQDFSSNSVFLPSYKQLRFEDKITRDSFPSLYYLYFIALFRNAHLFLSLNPSLNLLRWHFAIFHLLVHFRKSISSSFIRRVDLIKLDSWKAYYEGLLWSFIQKTNVIQYSCFVCTTFPGSSFSLKAFISILHSTPSSEHFSHLRRKKNSFCTKTVCGHSSKKMRGRFFQNNLNKSKKKLVSGRICHGL
jgi:hypothetical protein